MKIKKKKNVQEIIEDFMGTHCITAIDVGIINLALVQYCKRTNVFIRRTLVNITEFNCKKNCKLRHKKCMSNYIDHLFINYSIYFASATLLVEQQPPMGHVSVEQLIYARVPDCIIIHPRSVHAYHDIGHYDYEMRKKASERIAGNFLCLTEFERKHDIADAVCIILYYVNLLNKQLEMPKVINDSNFKKSIQSFIYKG